MTKIWALFCVLGLIGCEEVQQQPCITPTTTFFQGEHDLYPLDNNGFSVGSGTLVYVDGFMGDTASAKAVNFVWKNNSDQYVMSSLPFSKVRFQVGDNNYRAYCKFRWFENEWKESQWQNNVVYVLFILKPDQIKFKKR